jgi:hypothetical protein
VWLLHATVSRSRARRRRSRRLEDDGHQACRERSATRQRSEPCGFRPGFTIDVDYQQDRRKYRLDVSGRRPAVSASAAFIDLLPAMPQHPACVALRAADRTFTFCGLRVGHLVGMMGCSGRGTSIDAFLRVKTPLIPDAADTRSRFTEPWWSGRAVVLSWS